MQFCFADDSQQAAPTRAGMRPVVGVGGVLLEASAVGPVQHSIDRLCQESGFPDGQEFKWSPGRELWMRDGLRGARRQEFFLGVLSVLAEHGARVVVVVVDREAQPATGAETPEEDATRLFLERASNEFAGAREDGVVIVDRPPGNRAAENRFVADCVDHLLDAETYTVAERFALPVLAAQSRFVRLLQVADVVTSSCLSFVSGETQYSPPIFEALRPLFARQGDRVGGVGLKIHPDFRYGNLYHWLVGDTHFWKRNSGHPMPVADLSLYHTDAGMP